MKVRRRIRREAVALFAGGQRRSPRAIRTSGLNMLELSGILLSMNKLSTEERVRVVAALVEGNSIRATVRMTGVARNLPITRTAIDEARAALAAARGEKP